MAELLVDYFVTVEGFAEGEGWPAYFGLDGPDLQAWVNEQMEDDHLMIMGANTYRTLTAYSDSEDPMAERRKIVFSSTIEPPLSWTNTELISDDAVETVRRLKHNEPGWMRTIGSPSLSRSLITAGLVDRIRLMIFPLILGATGRQPIFDGLPDLELDLVSARTLDGRLQLLEYAPTVR